MSKFTDSNNPMLREEAFRKEPLHPDSVAGHATVSGSIDKTMILFAILLVTTYISFQMPSSLFLYGGLFGGLILFFIAMAKPHTSPVTAPFYAAFEGLFVGTISSMYAAAFEGIVLQAVTLTFATLFAMLMIYKTGIIKVTKSFKTGVFMATGAIMLVYLVAWIGHFAGFQIPFLHDSGPLGIGICVVFIGVACLNLIIDFDMFEKAEQHGSPKYMEWFCGMALMVTLVWLYIEFLRLLSKLRD